MPRFTRKSALRRSIQEARHSRKPYARNNLESLASFELDLAGLQFLLRLIQALQIHQLAVTDEDRKKATFLYLVGLIELVPGVDHGVKLLEFAYHLRSRANKELEVLDEALRILNHKRFVLTRISRGRKELRNAWFSQVLEEGGDGFIKLARMSKPAFNHLVDLIEDDPVFSNNSNVPQAPVWWQALVGLANLGTAGNGGDHYHLARMFNCSEGSVQNWTNRFITAVLRLEQGYLRWPSPQERAVLKQEITSKSFFKDTVGFVDGSYIPLATAPRETPEDYWTRKMFYAFNIMLVCDLHRRVTYYELGWCGSVHDQRVFRSSKLFENPNRYFSPGEYLLADSGYTVCDFVIPCLKRCRGHSLRQDQDAFNKEISFIRVTIEHCIGMVKGRFQSLKELRLVIDDAISAERANQWIRACLILHNFLISIQEEWSGVLGSISEGLQNTARARQPPNNPPVLDDEEWLLRSDRNESRRNHLFAEFL